MIKCEIGDLVESRWKTCWCLQSTIELGSVCQIHACGGGIYSRAVVVSVEPFVLVSEDGDMMWRKIKKSDVRRIGKAFGNVLIVAMARFFSGS